MRGGRGADVDPDELLGQARGDARHLRRQRLGHSSTYLDAEHPLQRAIQATFEELTGEPVASVAVDGCGAPLLSASLVGLAGAFRRLAVAEDGPERRVADAIRSHPAWVSGTRRDERALLTAIPGAIGKAGAESCYAVALPDGRAFALKIDDGAARVRPVVMAAALQQVRRGRRAGRRRRRRTPDRGGAAPRWWSSVGEIRAGRVTGFGGDETRADHRHHRPGRFLPG